MTTVRFSDDLRSTIERKAKKIFQERVQEAEITPVNWAGNIYDLAFKDTKKMMYDLPKGYFRTQQNLSFTGFRGTGWDENFNKAAHLSFDDSQNVDVKGGQSNYRRFPYDMSETDGESLGLTIGVRSSSWVLNADDPRWKDIKEEYREWCQKIHTLEHEQKMFVDGVKEVINAYSTLAPALKAWPALWDLVPEEKKEKHREVLVRTKASETAKNLAEEVDLSKLTGHVTANKLTR